MKIAFLGDIALIGKYDLTKNSNVKSRLKKISQKLKEYDYVIANLESPLTNKDKTLTCKSMHLRSPIVNVELLKYLGIDSVSLANNHIYDYGRQGIEDTIKNLEEYNIEWFGANSKFITKEINNNKISISGFVCYSTNAVSYNRDNQHRGVNLLSYNNLIEQLEKDEKNNSLSVMSFHWGDEHTNYPKYEHIKLAEKLAKMKNIIIAGHHPHVVQGVQKYKSSLVSYSLGNFLFDDVKTINNSFELKQTKRNKKSFILEVEIKNNQIVNYDYIGFKDKKYGIDFFNINNEIKKISNGLENIKSKKKYEKKRNIQIKQSLEKKFGKRDLSWLKSRLNYYSVGAFILGKWRKIEYEKEKIKFLDGVKDE